MSKKELEKSRKKQKEGFSAYEIYQQTHYLLWPVLLWSGEELECSQEKSKKSLILKALKAKPPGLYFFTPGHCNKVAVFPFNGKVVSHAKLCLGFLKKVQKDFQKKYGDSQEWYTRINSRIRFLKTILSNFESYEKKHFKSLALEEQIFFLSSNKKRPSHFLSTSDIKEYDYKKFELLKKVILTKRKVKLTWEGKWDEFIKKYESFSPELISKLYHSKQFNAQTLKSICSFDEDLILDLLEEMRLNGELYPDSINLLPLLFSELQKFIHEPEIRACLCRDFIHDIFMDKSMLKPFINSFILNFEEVNDYCTEFLKSHLESQGISCNRDRCTVFDIIHWFTGVSTKKAKKDIYLPSTYHSKKLTETYEKKFLQKCMKLMPKLQKVKFFNIASTFLQLVGNDKNSAPILNIINTCREFCPPGQDGNNALNLANFILQNIIDKDPKFIEWIGKNLTQLLVHAHNKTMDDQFHSPEFDKTKSFIEELLKLTPSIYSSKLSDRFLSDSKLMYTLVYISPEQGVIEWILKQDDEWVQSAIENRYNWDYILGMPEPFLGKVLSWGAELKKSKMSWDDISEILYSIEDLRTESNESQILQNLKYFKQTYLFSQKINELIKKKFKVERVDSYDDICGFYEYIDKVDKGWQNIEQFMNLFYEFIESYLSEYKGEDHSVYQGYYKINWMACFKVSPERFVEILKAIPIYHNSFYENTLQPLSWISKHHPLVLNFIDSSLKDRESFNRIIHILKMLKVSMRLNQSRLNKYLEKWASHESDDGLEELKFFRKMAKFDTDLPGNVRKVIELPEKLQREEESLTSLKEKGKLSDSALQRLNKVRDWLNNKKRLQKNIESDLKKIIPEATANAKMDSLIEISEQLCKEHWRSFATRPVEKWDDDWRNALQLSFMTDHNKRILRKLMLNAAGNDFQWIFYHPKNVKFINDLPKGFDQGTWISPPTLSFKVGNKSYSVEAERNLLKILQMGNYFGSCLSVGDMNDFSTIANAVEINKHVLWIKNSKGKIVGRKLIVLNQHGELYGFNSYGAAVSTENEFPWFKIMFDLYCLKLIEHCKGSLCNKRKEDDKIVLFSKWYDDGIERFDGWVMDLQRGRKNSYISKKVKFKTKHGVNLRAALWLKSQGAEINSEWEDVKNFQNYCTEKFEIIQK